MEPRKSKLAEEQARDSIVTDPAEIVRIEAANAIKQFDAALAVIDSAVRAPGPFVLRPSLICEMNRLGIDGLWRSAGVYRHIPIAIGGSRHTPPPASEVPRLV